MFSDVSSRPINKPICLTVFWSVRLSFGLLVGNAFEKRLENRCSSADETQGKPEYISRSLTLDAFLHLYKRPCPMSIRRSVNRLVL